jgi:hypothetical protein
MRIDLVGTTADFRRPGPQNPLLLNHLPGENRRMAGRIGEVGLDTNCRKGIDLREARPALSLGMRTLLTAVTMPMG